MVAAGYSVLPQAIKERMHTLPSSLTSNIGGILGRDDEPVEVEHFQYEQKLDRTLLSRRSVIGLGFGLMSPVLGMSTTLGIGLVHGGPPTILGAFALCGFMSWLTALAIGEVVSKYPIELHGSVALLAPERYRLVAAYYTGCLILLGNWVMNASIQYAGAQLIISLIAISGDLVSEENLAIWTVAVYFLSITVTGVINAKFASFLEPINTVCIYWILYAVVFIDVLLILFHKGSFKPFLSAFSNFDNRLSGYESMFLSFLVGGLQQSNFTLQGFSMLPALSDETQEPEKDIPKGMSQAVLVSTVCGVIYLVPLLLVMPPPEEVMSDSRVMEIVLLFTKSTRSNIVSYLQVMLILGNLLFSGIGSITTSSRAVYSISRDHAIPYHELWSYVSPESQSQVPKYAVYLSMAASYIFGFLPLVSGTAYNSFIGASVMCLCSASGVAVICVMLNGRRGVKGAAVKIRYRLGWPVSILVLLWLLLVMFCMCMPVTRPVTFSSMNYTSCIFAVFLVGIGALYNLWGKYHFKIPQIYESIPLTSRGTTVSPLMLDSPSKAEDTFLTQNSLTTVVGQGSAGPSHC
ncbi:AaceriAEL125Cp [[Ashbya] aceris (nom. inval.)]|nr:AaceriAEL125Cp [[Ashbya] aceris (nom. inval.)]